MKNQNTSFRAYIITTVLLVCLLLAGGIIVMRSMTGPETASGRRASPKTDSTSSPDKKTDPSPGRNYKGADDSETDGTDLRSWLGLDAVLRILDPGKEDGSMAAAPSLPAASSESTAAKDTSEAGRAAASDTSKEKPTAQQKVSEQVPAASTAVKNTSEAGRAATSDTSEEKAAAKQKASTQTPAAASQNKKEETPVAKEAPEASKETSEKTSEKTAEEASKKTATEAPEEMSKKASKGTSKETAEEAPGENPKKASKEAATEASEETSGETSKKASEETSKEPSQKDTSSGGLTKLQKQYVRAWEDFHGRAFPLNAPLHNYNWKYLQYDADGRIRYDGDKNYTIRHGIDVSEFQGKIDWKAVRESGIDFVFVRAGYRMFESGDLFQDSRAVKNLIRAKKAGLEVGVYVFSQAISKAEAREEAQLCLDVIKESGVEVTLPVVFDPEIQIEYYARINYIDGTQFTDNALAFCEAIHKAGYTPAVYANCSTETDILDMSRLDGKAVLWYADYNPVPESPYRFTFWQYSNTGWVDGIPETETDLNVWFVEK